MLPTAPLISLLNINYDVQTLKAGNTAMPMFLTSCETDITI